MPSQNRDGADPPDRQEEEDIKDKEKGASGRRHRSPGLIHQVVGLDGSVGVADHRLPPPAVFLLCPHDAIGAVRLVPRQERYQRQRGPIGGATCLYERIQRGAHHTWAPWWNDAGHHGSVLQGDQHQIPGLCKGETSNEDLVAEPGLFQVVVRDRRSGSGHADAKLLQREVAWRPEGEPDRIPFGGQSTPGPSPI